MLIASWLINLIWSSKMLYGNTYKKWETAATNCLPSDCLAKLYVKRRPGVKEDFWCQCSTGHFTWGLCGRHKFAKKVLLCNTRLLLCEYNWLWQWVSDTHRMHCCVFTATMVTRTCHSVRLYVYCLSCYNWDGVCLLRGTFYILRSAHTMYLCVLCGSENKQRLFHCTALTGWFL